MLASPYEQFLEALLEAEVLARVASDTRMYGTPRGLRHRPCNWSCASRAPKSATSSKARRGGSSGTACSWSTRSATAAGAPGCQPDLRVGLVPRRARSIVVTSDRGFEQWGDIRGDAMIAGVPIDRLVHHATLVTLKGKSYRLRERHAPRT